MRRKILLFLLPPALLLLLKWPALVSGTEVCLHDTLKHFPFFAYFLNNFGWGPPLWSPFTHSGEAFFPYIAANGLLKPDMALFLALHKLAPGLPTVRLFHWEIFTSLVLFTSGGYLFLSKLAKNQFCALPGYCGLVFGTIGLCVWVQSFGALDAIFFLPWILYFLHGALFEGRRGFLVPACACLGAAIGCYIPVFLYAYLGFLALGAYIELKLSDPETRKTARAWFAGFFFGKANRPYIAAGAAVFTACALPALAVLLESRSLFPIARVFSGCYLPESGLMLPFSFADQGVPSYLRDITSGWLPLAVTTTIHSALPLYLTLPVFLLAVLGIARGKGRGRIALITAALLSFWASLGAGAGLSSVLGFIPGFTAARQMEMFMPFAVFSLAALSVYGCEYAAENYQAVREAFIKRRLLWSGLLLALYAAGGALKWWGFHSALQVSLVYGVFAVWLVNLIFVKQARSAFILLMGFICVDASVNHLSTRRRYFAPVPPQLNAYKPSLITYNERREWTVKPLLDASSLYLESTCFSFGEPFILHKDSAFFADNLRFFIPKPYYDYLGRLNLVSFWNQPGLPAKDWQDRLGITAPKASVKGGSALIKAYGTDFAVFEAHAAKDRDFVYLDGFHPGWRAFVNGRPVPVLKHDDVFKKVSLPAGTHEVRFEFHAPLFAYGFWLYVLGLFAGVVFALLSLRRDSTFSEKL